MSYGSDHDPYDMWVCASYRVAQTTAPRTVSLYMVHHHTHSNILLLCEPPYISVGVVHATTETLTARRHMEYDLCQDPCGCCCHCLVTLFHLILLTNMLALCSSLHEYEHTTITTHYAYALALMLWPAACTLCVLMLLLSPSAHQHPLWMWRSGS